MEIWLHSLDSFFQANLNSVKIVPIYNPCIYDGSSWSLYSFNNSLIENYKAKRRIVIPEYRSDSFDVNKVLIEYHERAKDTFISHGFTVNSLRGFSNYMKNDGASINCLTKVMYRNIKN